MRRAVLLVVSLVVALVVAPAALAARGGGGLAVSPAPGTPDASPQTQISVLGVPLRRMASLDLKGSVSGGHIGRWLSYSGARGASLLPERPFTPGETVRAVLRLRNGRVLRWSFDVARPGATPPILSVPGEQPDKLQHFVTASTLTPPRITVLRAGGASAGSIFLTPLPSPIVHPGGNNAVTITPVGPGGPMIVDGRGRLVWFQQLERPEVAADLRVQRFHGRRVLTWWQGRVTVAAYGVGEGVIADRSYRTLAVVHAGNGYDMDIHEFTLTPDGDALFTVNTPVLVHLPGTPAGALTSLLDSIVQEVDVRTGLVVWEWHALGHIPLSESLATPQNSTYYDAFHINSIQWLPGGRVLLSARDTSAVYLVARAGGRIVWTLGGNASSFALGPGARFWFQHDAQLLAGGRVSLFDDEAGPPQYAPSSRGLVLELDLRRHRAVAVRSLLRPGVTSAQSEGGVQTLSGGGWFVGFGAQPFFSQFSAAGKLVFDGALPQDDGTYRVYRFPWKARPASSPVVVPHLVTGGVDVYVSWNGATGVARWQVLAGPDAASLRVVGSAASTGFETRITVPAAGALYAVRALDARGRRMATSAAIAPV